MKELIKVETNEQGQKLVSGRELHKVLEIGARYNDWIKRMIDYGFQENVDYTVLLKSEYNSNGGRPQFTHILTLEMAKHIAMVQRTEIGMQVRNYFLECEKLALQQNTPSYLIEDSIKRAERWIEEEQDGLIDKSINLNDSRITLNYVNDDSPTAIEVSSYDDLIMDYYIYKGSKVINCQECGTRVLVKGKSRTQYCSNCKKEKELEKYKKYNEKRKKD